MEDREIEIKFYVSDLKKIEERLQEMGARLVQPRTLEVNLRFDTPQGDFGREYKVVRLRHDTASRLTYKGPSESVEGVRIRQEIEFIVGDFDAARKFLEALGLSICMIYEKFRTMYHLDEMDISLDELPYGKFVEIEGSDAARIKAANEKIGLDWEKGVPESYTMIFERLRQEQRLAFRDLAFENFRDLKIDSGILRLHPAD